MEKITKLEAVGMANANSKEQTDARLAALLMKIQSAKTIEEAKELADLALGDTYEARMIGSLVNFPIGSKDWYSRMLCYIRDVGIYMQQNELDERKRLMWGKQIEDYASHLIQNYDKIPFRY